MLLGAREEVKVSLNGDPHTLIVSNCQATSTFWIKLPFRTLLRCSAQMALFLSPLGAEKRLHCGGAAEPFDRLADATDGLHGKV